MPAGWLLLAQVPSPQRGARLKPALLQLAPAPLPRHSLRVLIAKRGLNEPGDAPEHDAFGDCEPSCGRHPPRLSHPKSQTKNSSPTLSHHTVDQPPKPHQSRWQPVPFLSFSSSSLPIPTIAGFNCFVTARIPVHPLLEHSRVDEPLSIGAPRRITKH